MAKLVSGRTHPFTATSGFDADTYQAGDIFSFGSSSISSNVVRLFDDPNNSIVFGGSGFAGNLTTGFTAGTIASIQLKVSGQMEFTVTGLSISAKEFFDFAAANLIDTLWKIGLRGNDTVLGTTFNDRLSGFDGNDALLGNHGDDTMDGGNGNDQLNGGLGRDVLRGSAGNDSILGLDGSDQIAGGEGNDNLRGDAGDDQLSGGSGNDVLTGGPGVDVLNGLAGSDTANYQTSTTGVNIDLNITGVQTAAGGAQGDRLTFIERLIGSSSASDKLTGDKFGNVLRGLAGADTLKGNAGNDRLEGGIGPDTLSGNAGIDTVVYSASLAGVTVDLRKTTPQSGGEAAGDKLSGFENLIGSGFADVLTGTSSSNAITGGKGADVMTGLAGIDTVIYSGSGKGVTVDLRKTTAQSGGDAAGDKISSFENVVGSSHADVLTGTAGKNVLEGGKGADRLIGGTGVDTASYSSSSKAVWVGLGSVAVSLFAGDAIGDTFFSIENITGSKFGDQLFGSDGANVLSGGTGNDTLNGGLGNDTHFGGTGDDAFDYRYLNVFDLERDGKDIISDFKAGAASGDQLRFITDAIPQNFAGAMSIATQVGANTVFTFDANNTLTLLNVQKSLLTSDDILFFGLN